MKTSWMSAPWTPADSRAAEMAALPKAVAGTEERLPRNDPIGVRRAETITTFLLISDGCVAQRYHGRNHAHWHSLGVRSCDHPPPRCVLAQKLEYTSQLKAAIFWFKVPARDPVQIWLRLKRSETSGRFSFHHPEKLFWNPGLDLPHGVQLGVRHDDPEKVNPLSAQWVGCILSEAAHHAIVMAQTGQDVGNVL